eukprot:UN31702
MYDNGQCVEDDQSFCPTSCVEMCGWIHNLFYEGDKGGRIEHFLELYSIGSAWSVCTSLDASLEAWSSAYAEWKPEAEPLLDNPDTYIPLWLIVATMGEFFGYEAERYQKGMRLCLETEECLEHLDRDSASMCYEDIIYPIETALVDYCPPGTARNDNPTDR